MPTAEVARRRRALARRVWTWTAAKRPKWRILTKRGWEEVFEEAADEFDGMTRRAAVTAGAKDQGLVVEMEQAAVGDGDAMGVVAEIAKDLLRSAEGALGVNDPALVVEPLAATTRGAWLRGVVEFPSAKSVLRPARNFPRKSLPRVCTGNRNWDGAAIQRAPSRESPPPETRQWTWG
jgi:hypothetical protein